MAGIERLIGGAWGEEKRKGGLGLVRETTIIRATRTEGEEPKLAIVIIRTTLTLVCERLRIKKLTPSSQL